jgi:hypothetical protein
VIRLARLGALFAVVLGAWCIGLAAPADARSHAGDVTRVFQNVDIGPSETVDGNLNVVFGDATVEGVVHGDCNAVFGTCQAVDSGVIDGNVNSIDNDAVRAFAPQWLDSMVDQDRRLMGSLASSAVVVLVFLLFPMRTRIALGRIERHPALAGFVGALGTVAVFPIALLLIVSLIGIPLVLVEAAALFGGVWIGTGAIALVVGRRLSELVMPHATPSPLIALILGLVVVSAAEIVPIVGWIVTALVWCVGLGAAILSFMRSNEIDGPAAQRPVIGGPPMTGRSY